MTIRAARAQFLPTPPLPALPLAVQARFLPFALLFLLATPAAAETDRSIYFAIEYGTSDVSSDLGDSFDAILDGDDDSRSYRAGFRFHKYFAVEGAYHDFGTTTGSGCPGGVLCITPNIQSVPVRAETTAYSVALVPQLALTRRIRLFVSAGLLAWDSEISLEEGGSPDLDLDDVSDEEFLYGGGLELRILGAFSVTGRLERAGDIEAVSLGLRLSL